MPCLTSCLPAPMRSGGLDGLPMFSAAHLADENED